jgi:hypothetical protein
MGTLLGQRSSSEGQSRNGGSSAVKQIAFAILAPAIAILTAAALQPLVVMMVPSIQAQSIAMVSLDSYLEIVALLGVSFCAACLVKRRTPGRGALIASFLGPVASLALIVAAVPQAFLLNASTMSAFRAVLWMTAVAPLLGTALAYAVVSSNVARAP